MDFDEWEKMKEYEEGRGAYQSLYDAVGRTVGGMYEGIDSYVCDSCHSSFMSNDGQCQHCLSWDTHKV